MKIDISDAFQTLGYSIYEFYQRPGTGFYIPLYQREYSWDKENVEQLLDDIAKGVDALLSHEDEIRFLGTIISVDETDKKRIQPQDPRSLPPTIEKIIDGQQRLTTISLLAALLYKHLVDIETKLTKLNTINKSDFEEICTNWKSKLIDIFSTDLRTGRPTRKPKIIRGHIDYWVKEGVNADAYKSDAALFFADFILAHDNNNGLDVKLQKSKGRFSENYKLIDKWLKDISLTHTDSESSYPKAWELLEKEYMQEYIWMYDRENLLDIINLKDAENKKSEAFHLSSLVQILGICHYVLERCCFTVIRPQNEEWAFDMFQSLNASGTPLTAIETFRPLVVNTTESEKIKFENSDIRTYFERIENLFKDSANAASKSKLTKEFLTSIATVINSFQLASHFSSQRKYLDKIYNDLPSYESQSELIQFMGNYATFYKEIWIDYKGDNNLPIDKISAHPEAELASLLILFLKKSNHRMAITVLAYFYHDILTGREESINNFIGAVKAISAFYIIWRSARPNAGLDNIYRNFFKGIKNPSKVDYSHKPQMWSETKSTGLSLSLLKQYLTNVLVDEKLSSEYDWASKAINYLKYKNSSSICYFALLVSSHDTIPDDTKPGLMKIGSLKSSYPYLTLNQWQSKELKEIEHIAPKSNENGWDEALYDSQNELYDSIGNLTLLPAVINQSASNKGWKEKFIYYQHLAQNDPSKVQELAIKAQNLGIILKKDIIDILQRSSYNNHIAPLLRLENNDWNKDIVEDRALRILQILWHRINNWI